LPSATSPAATRPKDTLKSAFNGADADTDRLLAVRGQGGNVDEKQASGRCRGTTRKGERCRLRARPDDELCVRHAGPAANENLGSLDGYPWTTDQTSTPSDHVRRVIDNLPLSLRQRLDAASRSGSQPVLPGEDATRPATNGPPLRLALLAFSLLSIWGLYAMNGNAGGSACQQTVDDIHSEIDEAGRQVGC